MKQLLLFSLLLFSVISFSQVGIGTTTPNSSAQLDVTSTSKGFLPPRQTWVQIKAIVSPTAGLMIWCTDCGPDGELVVYNGLDWTGVGVGVPAIAVPSITNPTTGKIWMDRNLGATQVAISSADANAYGDLYQWGRGADGHQIRTSGTTTTLSSIDVPGNANFIRTSTSPYDWRIPQNTNLWQGVNGVNNPCPSGYRLPTATELDAERLSWSSNNSAGAFASPLKLPNAGYRYWDGIIGYVSEGNKGYYWSSTVSGVYSVFLSLHSIDAFVTNGGRATGMSVRCIKKSIGTLSSITCGSATSNGTLTSGSAASGVSSYVPYTGGNGETHSGQTVTSTGVTGLTATLSASTFAVGSGSLTYTITGTPSTSGTATFALSIGGQTCNLTRTVNAPFVCGTSTVTFTYNGQSVTYGTVSSAGSKCWLDRNLGATQVLDNSYHYDSYGDLFQWGRGDDGHQIFNSNTTSTLSSSDTPGNALFITTTGFNDPDWRSPKNDNLWQGVNGVNNPCPSGFRLPTETEFNAERLSWSSNNENGAFGSPLKLPVAGTRSNEDGSYSWDGLIGYYWTSTIVGNNSRFLSLSNNDAIISSSYRSSGHSVRCLKD